MEVNNIDDLIKLAGLVNNQAPTATAESEVEESDCGCSDEQPAAVMANGPDMYAILARLAKMGEIHEEEPVSEWSNSPADELTGEPESRVMDQPKGEPVDTSLRRHLGANGQVVKVEEGIVDHTVEDMMEAYNAYKATNEGTKGCADCEYMKDETDGEIDTCDECAAEERAKATSMENIEAEESYSPGDENAEGMVSNCCGAPIMDVYQGHGRCSDCKEMASAERVEETVNEDPSKPSFPQTVELAGDSIWDRETPNPQSVTVTDYEMEEEDGYVHVKVMHDGPWTIYTDTGFEKAISEMIGMKVTFTEQGMQQEGVASLEGGTDMDEEINILKRNAGV